MSGSRRDRKSSSGKKPLTHGWIVVPSKTYPDRVYFYNTITKCSTWTNPCEDLNTSDRSSSESLSPRRSRSSRRKRKRSKHQSRSQKSNKKVLDSEVSTKENDEIEDYDEDHDQYFNNLLVTSNRSAVSPSSSPDPVTAEKQISETRLPKTNLTSEEEKKELWLHFASNPGNPNAKKSVAMSDLNTPSTSQKLSEIDKDNHRQKISPRSRFSVYEQSPIIDPEKEIQLSRKKKKKKRTQYHSEDRRKSDDKVINNVAFKRRDKTPAQTRLLKLRQQNAEMLKKLAANHSNSQDCDLSQPLTPVTSTRPNIDITSGAGSNELTQKVNDFEEEMDWEPSSEELDVQNINEFRQKRDKANNISNNVLVGLEVANAPSLPSESDTWLLVLDTNIFVSCLGFVKELRDTNIPGLGYPILYIPWRVLQELDHLKDFSKFEFTDRPFNYTIRRSIAYLNENFKSRHPRCFGQSFEDFAKMVDVENSAPDDEILQTCIQLQKLYPEKKLTLLTNDKNLESKAIISKVEAYSKEGFQKKYLSSSFVPSRNGITKSVSVDVNQLDNVVCSVKNLLKILIPKVVETEMKKAFQGDWIKLAYKKPPWTLQDSMDCFTKHWRSVFFLVFPKDALFEIEKLYQQLFKKEPGSPEDVCELIKVILKLVSLMEKSQEKDPSYSDILESTKVKLLSLLNEMSPKKSQVECGSSVTPSCSKQNSIHIIKEFNAEISTENDVQLAKNLFREIWDALRSFCCMVSDIINSSGTNNNISIPEIRLKLTQILNEMNELLLISDELVEVNVSEICEEHPLLIRLTHFLIKICPTMAADIRERLSECLVAFFTDLEGRSLLCRSLVDFREFSQDLIKANEYFEKTYPTF